MTPRAKEYLDFIINGSTDMSDMVNEMLNYSKIQSQNEAELEEIDVKQLLEDLQLKLQDQISTSKAQINIGSIPEKVFGKKIRIGQLFQNLISNAIKFKKEGQSIEINISGVEEDNCYRFKIQDNGIGISPEYHEKIFLLFNKLHAKSAYSGSGIGLATCKKIALMHKGDIHVDSLPGHGAAFNFTISKSLYN